MNDDDNMVFVFNGEHNHFPSAVFSSRAKAEEWIARNHLGGTLTAYPLDVSVYEWAINQKYFAPKGDYQRTSAFVANFSSAFTGHWHYGIDDHNEPD